MGAGVLFLLAVLACALPDAMPNALGLHAHAPDLWVATTAYLALRARGYQAVGWAIGLGLVRDAVSLDPLGTHGFVLGCVAFLFAEGSGERGRVEGVVRLVWTFAAAVSAGTIYLLRVVPLGYPVTLAAFADVLPGALWTTVLGATLFPLLDWTRGLDDVCGRTRGLPA